MQGQLTIGVTEHPERYSESDMVFIGQNNYSIRYGMNITRSSGVGNQSFQGGPSSTISSDMNTTSEYIF